MSKDGSSGEVVHQPGAAHRLDERAIVEVLEIEKRRIDRDNRRTAAIEKALEIEDAESQRQFTYASQTRDAELGLQKDHLDFVRKVVWALLGCGGVTILVLLGLLIFGEDAQRTAASAVVKPLLLGIAGYGVITGVSKAINRVAGR